MARKTFADMWCPLGRISVQQIEAGGVRAVATGGFNQVALAQEYNGQVQGQSPWLASKCAGPMCALYRRGWSPLFGWGRCSMARPSVWGNVWAAAILAAALVLAACILR